MAKESKQSETALDPYAVDLNSGQEMPPIEPIPKGWHKFFLTDYQMVDKPATVDDNGNEVGPKRYIDLTLQHEETGGTRHAFVNWPLPGDFDRQLINSKTGQPMFDKDGEPMTPGGSKVSTIKTVVSALGGPESGGITPDTFAQLIGNAAMFLVTVSEYPKGSGELRDQVDLAFGRGIKPC